MTDEEFAALKQRSAQANQEVQDANAALQDLVNERAGLTEALNAARAEVEKLNAEDGMKATWLATITDYESKLALLAPRIMQAQQTATEVVGVFDKINAQVQAAESPGEAFAGVVREGGTAAAPLAGPYAPLALVGSHFIAGLISRIWGKRAGVRSVVQPLEAARVRSSEAEIMGDMLVIDKNAATVGHLATGVLGLIKSATK